MSFPIYVIYSAGLFLWTISSIHYDSPLPAAQYGLGQLLILAALTIMFMADKGKKAIPGLVIAAVFCSLGLSIAYRFAGEKASIQLEDVYTGDLISMIVVFFIVYLLIRFTNIYRIKLINLLAGGGLLLAVYGARLTSALTGGSYLYFGGIMIFGWALLAFPFTAAFLISRREDSYVRGNVRSLPWNLMLMLLYVIILFAGCVLCNEFGLILIIGLTATVLFFIRCRNLLTKCFYTISCAGAAVLSAMKVPHVHDRMQIWLHPAAAAGSEDLAGKAESVLYLFRHLGQAGLWGRGIGSLPVSYYPTLNTDHVMVTLINDYSLILAGLVLALSLFFIRWLLTLPDGLCGYDRYLNLTTALLFGFLILVHTASNLGSFLTAGIGFHWISEGSSVNIMLTVLLAVHCGLLGKKAIS